MSQLTVPKAGVDPGPVASTRIPESDLGSSVRQLGGVMQQVGTQLESDRLDRQMKRLGVDLTRDMNQLTLDLQQIGDPDQLEAAFQTGIEDLRNSYLNGQTETGRARVDPRNVVNFNLAFDDLRNSHERAVAKRSLAGRFAQREATLLEMMHVATNAAATADAETRAVMLDNTIAQIDDAEATGVINAEEAEQRRLSVHSKMDGAAAVRMLDEDPAEFLEALDAGEFAGLDGETLSRYRTRAQANIDRQHDKDQKQAEMELAARGKEIKAQFSEYRDILEAGGSAAKLLEFMSDPMVQGHEGFPKFQAFVDLHDAYPSLEAMRPADVQKLHDELAATPAQDDTHVETLVELQRIADRGKELWSKDPIGEARKRGIVNLQLPEFDPENPRAFATAIGRYVSTSQLLNDQGYTTNKSAFDPETKAEIDQLIKDTTDPMARANLAAALTSGLVSRPASLDEVLPDDAFRAAGGLLAGGGAPQIGESIMRGQAIIDAGAIVMPPMADRLSGSLRIFETHLLDMDGGQIHKQMMTAADARYADVYGKLNADGQLDEGRYIQALHEVVGGSGRWDSSDARGGIQEVFGVPTILPPDMSAEDIEEAMGAAPPSEPFPTKGSGLPGGPQMYFSRRAFTDEELSAASITGEPPVIGGQPIGPQTLSRSYIRAVVDPEIGPAYEIVYRNASGRLLTPFTASGKPYRFNLKALLQRGEK